jgi:hypothetical protein
MSGHPRIYVSRRTAYLAEVMSRLPDPGFVGMVVVICLFALGTNWIIGIHGGYVFAAWSALLATSVTVVVRTVSALSPPRRSLWALMAWTCVSSLVLVATMALLLGSAPSKWRLALSRDDLDAYARSVAAEKECGSFPKRRVGFYTVTCAIRADDRIFLQVEDRLTDRPSNWHLLVIGPRWELHAQD